MANTYTNVKSILDELNADNGSNYKMDTLKKYKDDELVQRVFKMAMDKVLFTYGVTLKKLPKGEASFSDLDLPTALDNLEDEICSRDITGDKAKQYVANLIASLNEDDAYVLERIIDRTLKVGMGRSNVNKVIKKLIVKPPYKGCLSYSKELAEKYKFPAFIQLKADGRFVAVTVDGGVATFQARSGEEDKFPVLAKEFEKLQDGVYIGEMLVRGLTNRADGNGLINSDDKPHDDIYMQIWDYVTADEYARPKDKKDKTPYTERFAELTKILSAPDVDTTRLEIIESYLVNSLSEALAHVSKWMNLGYEGGVLKEPKSIFRDGKAKDQLKLKLVISLEMRFTSFNKGNEGSKNEAYFSGVNFENDEGSIKGTVGVTSMTEAVRDWFHTHRDEVIGQVAEIECNDITKGRDNDYHALSHPRYIELRGLDKDTTDTLAQAFEAKQMAMDLGEAL